MTKSWVNIIKHKDITHVRGNRREQQREARGQKEIQVARSKKARQRKSLDRESADID